MAKHYWCTDKERQFLGSPQCVVANIQKVVTLAFKSYWLFIFCFALLGNIHSLNMHH